MLSVRTLARSAPRTLGRITSASLRQGVVVVRRAGANTAVVSLPAASSFSTTVRRPQPRNGPARGTSADGETDDELSAKIENEMRIEEDMKSSEQLPASVKDFLDNTPFTLVDAPGQEVVKLVRDFNGEKITVSFSVADINDYNPYDDAALGADEDADDEALALEDVPEGKRGKSAASEARTVDEDGEELGAEMDDEDVGVPTNLTIVVEKPGKVAGALSIDASIQDGAIVVDNLHYYDKATLARIDSPDDAHVRSETYPGPAFGTLDEDLQVLIERYLEERGITQSLAVFVPDYVNVKEQSEYLRWLRSVKGFIDA